jgi:hypothetical protein
VTATPLSAAAKASIINTIADSALASFVVIQVRQHHGQPDAAPCLPGICIGVLADCCG